MTIADKLDAILPVDGKPMTQTDRLIAEAVARLRQLEATAQAA